MNTQTSAPESIIRKIQLLLNMAERGKNADAATENEAALAMAKAQELLAQYNLEMAVVNSTRVAGGTVAQQPEKRERTQINRSAMYKWQIKLMSQIADANFCWHWVTEVREEYQKGGREGWEFTRSRRVKRHILLGTESNVAVAQMMYEYLAETIERVLPYPNVERLSRSAVSWREGCADRLIQRIADKFAKMREERGEAGEQSTALAIRNLDETEYAANYDASYGAGAYARMKARQAEMQRQQREEQELRRQLRANETAEQREAREKQEAKEYAKQAARSAKFWEREARKEQREQERKDPIAYARGHKKANDIGLDSQVKAGSDARRLG